MKTKHLCLFSAFIIAHVLIFVVDSSPVPGSQKTNNISTNKTRSSFISKSKGNIKNSSFKVRDSEEPEGEPEAEAEAEPQPSGTNGPRRGLPYFPSFNKPFEEFQADLDKIMEHINAGLEKVMEGFHELVHDPGLKHDDFYITGFDKDLFKNMIAKYDEAQAAKRRLAEKKANATLVKT